ncbi:MAG TPA: tetratricopeptide repeat protein [Terriglobia bacterium]|nr:tetratricopeptide repeat protein [Terriglobia bacterium]
MEPSFAAAFSTLGLGYEQTHQYAEAISALEKARDGSGGNPVSLAGLAHTLALAGRKREAREILSELKELSQRAYIAPYVMALVHAGLGERNRTLEWLEKAVDERDAYAVWIKHEPRFDSLRSTARSEDLLRRLRLPP